MKNPVKQVVLFFCLLGLTEVQAQTFKGTVTDKHSHQAVPYVNISVTGTIIGTISKDNGSFNLDLSERPKHADTVAFSIIGYETRKFLISELKDSMEIVLTPTSVNLEAVYISPLTPSELIKRAIMQIPENYVREPFNAIIYWRTMVKLNGKYVESSEALIQGYVMPVTGYDKDTTRLRLLALKYFDEQDLAIQSIVSKKRKKKGDKLAVEGMDTMLIDMSKNMNEAFGIYTQIDSNLIKRLHDDGYQEGKIKYNYGPLLQHNGRDILKLQFKGSFKGLARHAGNLLLDEKSLAFEAFNYKMESSSLRVKLLLMLAGIGFKSFDMVLGFRSAQTEDGWIPEALTGNIFIDMEKNKWFAKDIPLVMEMSSELRFLEISVPANDECRTGKLIKKKIPIQEQFKSEPNHPAWKQYESKIRKKP